MKRKSYHTKPTTEAEFKGPNYWRSLDELQGAPEFQEWVDQEFAEGASDLSAPDRRNFLKIMAASFGLAGVGMTGCRMPERRIYPYSKQPEYIIPGVATYYSTSMPFGRENIPLVVETHQARPTKVEGNPSYTLNGGGTNLFAQVSILDLYDPDRARKHHDSKGNFLSSKDVEAILAEKASNFKDTGGSGLAVLAEPSSSPTRARLVKAFKAAFPKAIWAEYEAVDFSNSSKSASKLLQQPSRPVLRLEKAKRILSFDSDFSGFDVHGTANARAFASGRRIKSAKEATKMSRLYAVESNLSLTGANADHRLRLASTNIPAFVNLVASHILVDIKAPDGFSKEQQKWAEKCADDLKSKKKQSLIVAGSNLSVEVHSIVYAMNEKLGANSSTVDYVAATEVSESESIQSLASKLNKQSIETLFILGGNPIYNAPGSAQWSIAQSKAKEIIRLGYAEDETSSSKGKKPTFIVQSHYLESWGDGRTWDGTYVPVQPMLEPLFQGFSDIEVLAHLTSDPKTNGNDLVKSTFAKLTGNSSSRAFSKWLSEGVLSKSEYKQISGSTGDSPSNKDFSPRVTTLSIENLELRFVPSSHTWDGRYANNGWAQECPHPITKVTWDNPILISAKLAEELEDVIPEAWRMSDKVFGQSLNQLVRRTNEFNRGREIAPIAEITVDGQTIKGPLHVQPGIADYTLILPLGHGRTKAGRVGEGTGHDFNPIRRSSDSSAISGATIRLTGDTYKLANTQEHWSMEGRAIVREATAEEYSKHPEFTSTLGMESHSPKLYPKIKDVNTGKWREMTEAEKVKHVPRGNSAYHPPNFTEIEKKSERLELLIPGRTSRDGLFDDDPDNDEVTQTYHQQWGMVVDFNTCIGCNACVVACQSENNIPVVGKDQVLRGREMHWMRIDRYFSNNAYREDGKPDKMEIPDDVQVSFHSMMCQQCDKAPCESVCPVNATVQDEQGLNTMAYNRCIGTRYCANNCPYKVRRFNFLDYNKRQEGHFYEGPLGPSGVNELHQMQKNPDVSVRMRGVMEKCTFCVQRIQEAKINHKAKNKGSGDVLVPDGTIQTACQQSCPTDAITFGDILDEKSKVSELKSSDRNYAVLGYLDTRPRTSYLSKIRNPNPEMPNAYLQPFTRKEYESRNGHGGEHGNNEDSHGASHDEDSIHKN
ncbi:MAG: TAT-variant-translocated molybdopterin oxidoreductase [Opitutae bacterium]|nr:TAT-variant-translocated molybdopterin oxidoreductase [Opitutae bacterium]